MTKRSRSIEISLAADTPSVDTAEWLEVGENGRLDLHIIIHAGSSLTAAPTGTPVGAWRLHCAGSTVAGARVVTPVRITAAESGANSLADATPNGNNVVNAVANFTDVPGTVCKLVYVRASGGTGDVATVIATGS